MLLKCLIGQKSPSTLIASEPLITLRTHFTASVYEDRSGAVKKHSDSHRWVLVPRSSNRRNLFLRPLKIFIHTFFEILMFVYFLQLQSKARNLNICLFASTFALKAVSSTDNNPSTQPTRLMILTKLLLFTFPF